MIVPKEVEELTKQILGSNVRIKITKSPIIQAAYNGLHNKVILSRGLIEAYSSGYISLKDIEAILWHEHGERIYFSYTFNASRIMKRLIIPLCIFCVPIYLASKVANPLLTEIIKSLAWLIPLSYFFSSYNRLKECMCDINSAIKMKTTQFIINALSKREQYNMKIKTGLFSKLYDLFTEACFEHPSTYKRVELLKKLTQLCNKQHAKGLNS